MRKNNYFEFDYIRDLKKANITPEMELKDCLELIRGKNYSNLELGLNNLDAWYRTKNFRKISKRRKDDMEDYALGIAEIPYYIIDRIRGTDDPFANPDLTPEQMEEIAILNWISNEILILKFRIWSGETYTEEAYA